MRSAVRLVSCSAAINMFVNGLCDFKSGAVSAGDTNGCENYTQHYRAASIFCSSSSAVAGCLDIQLGRFFENLDILIHALCPGEAIWTNPREVFGLAAVIILMHMRYSIKLSQQGCKQCHTVRIECSIYTILENIWQYGIGMIRHPNSKRATVPNKLK